VFVQAGLRIKYPAGPHPSKRGVQQQQQQQPATADAGTGMAGEAAAELSCFGGWDAAALPSCSISKGHV